MKQVLVVSKMDRERSGTMNSQDETGMSHKVRRETEVFINNYINDHAQGWPIRGHCDSVSIKYRQGRHIKKRGIMQILPAR
jgi:hypothetical protein